MEIKNITKTDGKRLFVEIGKAIREDKYLPIMKKGDKVAILPFRKLKSEDLDKLVGSYIKFLDLDEYQGFAMWFEGVLKLNKKSFWGNDEPVKGRFVLIDYTLSDNSDGEPLDAFDDLEVFDFKVLPDKIKSITKIKCANQKCKKYYLGEYKYCPYCGRRK